MLPSGISKIENGERKVDVDDLVALAVALDVSPVALLLPAEPGEGGQAYELGKAMPADVEITPRTAAPWEYAWRWAHGEIPLHTPRGEDDPSRNPGWWERRQRFLAENRPYVGPDDDIREVDRLLMARWPGGYDLELHNDGDGGVRGTITRRQRIGD